MNTCDIAVIGAGLAGLTAAYEYHKKRPEDKIVIFEQSRIGGQCVSHFSGGAWFDVGGHFFHNLDKLPADYQNFSDECKAFQKNTYSVDIHNKIYHGMIQNFFKTDNLPPKDTSNLASYYRTSFGDEVFSLFLKPYNSKLHILPLEECSVPAITSARTPPKGKVSYNNDFFYPVKNGAQSFIDFILKKVKDHVEFVYEKVAISSEEERIIKSESGCSWVAKKAIFNSGSLADYAGLSKISPTVWVINGFAAPNETFQHMNQPCWCYIANPSIPVFRIGNYEICGAPKKDRMIPFYMESCRPVEQEHFQYFFSKWQVTCSFLVRNAYPVATEQAEHTKQAILQRSAQNKIMWIGRYGLDRWFSMSETILDTIDKVKDIVN